MVDATGYFGGNYLKAADLTEETKLTIKDTEEVELEGKKKLVVYFDEIDKGLVLNKINMTRISKWAGSPMTEQWNGKVITLVSGEVEYDGKDVPCIRVKKKEEAA